jgi:hypothetical protein
VDCLSHGSTIRHRWAGNSAPTLFDCCAARGETVSYEDLAQRAHQQDKGLLTPPLDLVAGWCKANGLPALLVVETVTGKPPAGVEAAAEQERVREYNWYAIFPPSVAELTPAQSASL